MSADNGILISRKQKMAWYYQGDDIDIKVEPPIVEATTIDELLDKVHKWIDENEMILEYGIQFLD